RRQMLAYARPPNSLFLTNRLFTVRNVQPGVPGLRLEHVLFDSMHFADLGILAYFMAAVLWLLVRLGYFRNCVDAGRDEVGAAMGDASKQFQIVSARSGERHDPVQLGGVKPLTVGEGMVEYCAVMKSQPRNMEELALLRLQAVVDWAMNAWIATGHSCQMKWHVFGKHIVDQARWAGNPARPRNYRGESENFDTRKRAASINRTKFAVNSWVTWYLSHIQKQADT
ncbi:unnamed protein product, partial [Prorocentrum cordatum]